MSGVDKEHQTHHALFGVIEALEELDGGALPGSARADEGCGLPRLHRNAELVQDLSRDHMMFQNGCFQKSDSTLGFT